MQYVDDKSYVGDAEEARRNAKTDVALAEGTTSAIK